MNVLVKPAMILGLAGAMALGSMTPSEARSGRTWAAAGVGFAAGAMLGAAAANANRGYYYNEPYAYAPGPTYSGYSEPVYVEPGYGYNAYGYDSYPVYSAPRYRNDAGHRYRGGGSSGAAD